MNTANNNNTNSNNNNTNSNNNSNKANNSNKNNKERRAGFFTQRDVLGQETPPARVRGSRAHPSRIFLVVTILIVLFFVYWFFTR